MKIEKRFFLALCIFPISATAEASIISTTGPVVLISAPASVVPGKSVNVTDGQVFSETQDLTLTGALSVNAVAPGKYKNGVGSGGTIAAGTDVDSYFALFDSGGKSVTYGAVTLTFSTPVLGVIFDDSQLNKSDSILGISSTKYPTGGTYRGQEVGDSTQISANGYSITLDDTVSSPGDDIRIITAAGTSVAPEPGSLALLAGGLTTVGVWRRRARA